MSDANTTKKEFPEAPPVAKPADGGGLTLEGRIKIIYAYSVDARDTRDVQHPQTRAVVLNEYEICLPPGLYEYDQASMKHSVYHDQYVTVLNMSYPEGVWFTSPTSGSVKGQVPVKWVHNMVYRYKLFDLEFLKLHAPPDTEDLGILFSTVTILSVYLIAYENLIQFPPVDAEYGETECCLCLNGFDDTRTVQLACGHKFHRSCVLCWLYNKPGCPTCRTETKMTIKDVFKNSSRAVKKSVPAQYIHPSDETCVSKVNAFVDILQPPKKITGQGSNSNSVPTNIRVNPTELGAGGFTQFHNIIPEGVISSLITDIIHRVLECRNDFRMDEQPRDSDDETISRIAVMPRECEAIAAVVIIVSHIIKHGRVSIYNRRPEQRVTDIYTETASNFVLSIIQENWADIDHPEHRQSVDTYHTVMDKFIKETVDTNPHNRSVTPDSDHIYFKLSLRLRCLTGDLSSFERACMARTLRGAYTNFSGIKGSSAAIIFSRYWV